MLAADLAFALSPARWFTDLLGLDPDPWQVSYLESDAMQSVLNVTRQGGKTTAVAAKSLHRGLYGGAAFVPVVAPTKRQSRILVASLVELADRAKIRHRKASENPGGIELISGRRPDVLSVVLALPCSEATTRGLQGASWVVFDEAARIPQRVYRSIRPMLATTGGGVDALSTPFGKRGFYFEACTSRAGWERYIVPATECPRISAEFLERELAEMGKRWFEQEYFNKFLDTDDAVFEHELVLEAMSEEVTPLWE